MRRVMIVSMVLVLAALGGCSDDDDGGGEGAQGDADETLAFGDSFTWPDGLAMTVEAPQQFTPPDGAASDRPEHISVDIRIENGTEDSFDPLFVDFSIQSGSREAEQVESKENSRGYPQTPVLPGREVVFTLAYGVDDPADIVMQASADSEHGPVIFQS